MMSSDIKTNLKLIDIKKGENEAKGGFSVDPNMADFMPAEFQMPMDDKIEASILFTLDKTNTSLAELLESVPVQLGLAKGGTNDYGFLYDFKSNRNAPSAYKSYSFVKEEDLESLEDGFLFIVTASPKNYAKKMLYELTNIDLASSAEDPVPIWQTKLEMLFNLSQDFTFASEFHKLNGIRILADMIQNGSFDGHVPALCQLFCILLELMKHSALVKWREMSIQFVEKIADNVNGSAKFESNESLVLSINILLSIFDKGGELESVVREKVQFESLIRHLGKKDENVLLAVLTFMNLLFNHMNSSEQYSVLAFLHKQPFQFGIKDAIKFELKKPDERLKQQLILTQETCFTKQKDLAMRKPTLTEIENIVMMFEQDSSNETDQRKSSQASKELTPEAKKFADVVTLTPPGSLALGVILDYKQRHHQKLKNFQMESNLSIWIWLSIMANIVRYLVSVLSIVHEKIDDQPEVPIRPWLIMFNSKQPFYDLFALALDLFYRTWCEMHAKGDEEKVLHVVGEQIARGLSKNPASLKELDKILQKEFTYFHMQKIWEKERIDKVEEELNSSIVQDLRNHLKPSVEEILKNRTKNVLKKGFCFARVTKVPEEKLFYYLKLDEHEYFLWYSICPTTIDNTNLDSLKKKKLPIRYMKAIVTGSQHGETAVHQIGWKLLKRSPKLIKHTFTIEFHPSAVVLNRPKKIVEEKTDPEKPNFFLQLIQKEKAKAYLEAEKLKKKKEEEERLESIIFSEPLTLTANNDEIVVQWIDGLNILLGIASLDEKEINRLMNLEVRTRLLDVPKLPTTPPQIPDLPANFDWIPAKFRE